MEIYDLSEAMQLMSVDLRAEVIARELIEAGISTPDNTLIIPEGTFRRSFAKEVSNLAEEHVSEHLENRFVKINTVREGIPDMLPPGIIYQPVISREERTAEIMLEEAEIHDSEFRHARNFFLPLDIEFGRQRIAIEQFEHQSVADSYAHYSHDLYAYLWPDLKLELTLFQKAALLELTMNAHHSGNDFEIWRYYLEKILGHQIEIRSGNNAGSVTDELKEPAFLGHSILGVNWIPFENYQDQQCVKFIVGPVPVADMVHFRHHEPIGKNYRILEFLCELLLPVEISWSMVLIPSEGHFQINKGRETSVLGYSTILG